MGHFLMKMAVVLVDVFMAFLFVWQKHLTDAAKRRKGLLRLRVCRVSQSQRVRCGSHRRQACIVLSSGYIVSPMVTLYLQWLHCDLKWSHCVSSDHIVSLYSHIVSPVVPLYLQWLHCVSNGYIISPVVTLCLQQSHCVSSGYIVSPVTKQWDGSWCSTGSPLSFLFTLGSQFMIPGMMPSIFRAGLSSLWKLHHRLAQKCVS